MDYKLQLPSALDYFTTLVQSDDEFPLMETAVSIAQDEFPKMDIQQVLDEVDVLSAKLKRRLLPQADVLDKLRELNRFFYEDMRFAGNVNHYDDPHNSFFKCGPEQAPRHPHQPRGALARVGTKPRTQGQWCEFPWTFFGQT